MGHSEFFSRVSGDILLAPSFSWGKRYGELSVPWARHICRATALLHSSTLFPRLKGLLPNVAYDVGAVYDRAFFVTDGQFPAFGKSARS